MIRRLAVLCLACGLLTATSVANAGISSQGRFTIVTIPSVAGLHFRYKGAVYVTGPRGEVRVPVQNFRREVPLLKNPYLLARRVVLLDGRRPDGSEVAVERWYTSSRHGERILVAAFKKFVPVVFKFQNRKGAAFPVGKVGSVVIRRSDGEVRILKRRELAQPVLLQATRVVRSGGLVSKPLLYRVQAVNVDGNNLVNRAQQAFQPRTASTVPLKLLFFSARFSAKDRLFRFSIGSGIRLEFPNHRSREYKFDDNGELVLPALPRGNYRVTVHAAGIALTSPLALTRDQVVTIKVVSYPDVALIVVVLLAVALALLLARRPRLRARLRTAVARAPRPQQARARTSE